MPHAFSRRRVLRTAGALVATTGAAWLASPALAADPFPAKPVRILYPFSPGGGMEVVLRVMAQEIQKSTGQSFLVDNRTGGGGSIAVAATVAAPPDGYTIFVGPTGISAITPHLRKLPFDTQRDLVGIAKLSEFFPAFIVRSDFPAKTIEEFIAYAKANRGKVTYATSGVGSQGHLRGEMLQKSWGIKMTHVPYKGAADIVTDLIAGRIDTSHDVTLLQYVKQGKARLLGTFTDKRLEDFPDAPTIKELAVPQPEPGGTWFGAFAPKGTPQPVVDKLAAEFEKALRHPDVLARMKPYAMQPTFMGPRDFKRLWDTDYATYGKVIREAGIKVDE